MSESNTYYTIKGVDSGFQSIAKIHPNSITPRKKSKNKQLSDEDKKYNKELSSERIGNENAIGFIKRFKIERLEVDIKKSAVLS